MRIVGPGSLGALALVLAHGACSSTVYYVGEDDDDAVSSACALQCACTECSSKERAVCEEGIEQSRAEAKANGCGAELEDLDACYVEHFACDEDAHAIVGPTGADCEAQAAAYISCMHPGTGGASTTTTTTTVTTGSSSGCDAFVALCVSCGLGDLATCEGAVEGVDAAACWIAYKQLADQGC